MFSGSGDSDIPMSDIIHRYIYVPGVVKTVRYQFEWLVRETSMSLE